MKARGAPKKPANRICNVSVHVRLTKADKDRLEDICKSKYLTASKWVREKIHAESTSNTCSDEETS